MRWFGRDHEENAGAGGTPETAEGTERPGVAAKIREYVEAIVIAVVLALFIRGYIVQAYKIPSGSMLETLQIGDHLLVNKFLYGIKIPFTDKHVLAIREVRRGDVVVFKYPEDESKDFIKRVIGLPGDTIEVINKVVYLNGEPYTIPTERHTDPVVYPAELQPRDNLGPVTVPPGAYFVMGDNRDHSLDSRFWGFVRKDKIRGKAVIIYWSWDRNAHWIRFGRIGTLVR